MEIARRRDRGRNDQWRRTLSIATNVSKGDGGASDDPADAKPIVRLPHYGWWVTSAVLCYALVSLVLALAYNKQISWLDVRSYLFSPLILAGVQKTLLLTAAALGIGLILGTVIAILRLAQHPVPRAVAWGYIWVFRGTPGLVQLIFWFNLGLLFPNFTISVPMTDIVLFTTPTNNVMSALFCALLGLGLNEAAYMAEIVRGGIVGVDPGQQDAAKALGMTPWQTMTKIILPQAARLVIPPAGNELIIMLKSTSLVSIIGYAELLSTARRIYALNFKTIELLIVVSIWYLFLVSILSVLQQWVERRLARGHADGAGARLARRGMMR